MSLMINGAKKLLNASSGIFDNIDLAFSMSVTLLIFLLTFELICWCPSLNG